MRARTTLSAVALALLAVSACSGDDADTADAATVDAAADTTSVAGSGAGGATPTSLCRTWLAMDRVASDLGGPEVPPEQAAATAAELRDLLAGASDAPAELDEPLDVLRAVTVAAADGDPSGFDAEPTNVALTTVGRWVHDSCGFTPVELVYRDYTFDGIPDRVPAGPVSFRAANEGEELHVLVMVRVAEGVTGDPGDVVLEALSTSGGDPAALAAVAEPVVSGGFALPGGTGTVTAELEAGRYVTFCPIPIGFTGDGPPPPGALPHAAQGMIASLTVG